MPMFSDLSLYYGGSAFTASYYTSPYTSAGRSSAYTSPSYPSMPSFLSSPYARCPRLAPICEVSSSPLARRRHAGSPRTTPAQYRAAPRPLRIDTADIDVSSPRAAASRAQRDAPKGDGISRDGTIRRGRTVVRLHTRKRSPPAQARKQTPGEKLMEKFLIKDHEEERRKAEARMRLAAREESDRLAQLAQPVADPGANAQRRQSAELDALDVLLALDIEGTVPGKGVVPKDATPTRRPTRQKTYRGKRSSGDLEEACAAACAGPLPLRRSQSAELDALDCLLVAQGDVIDGVGLDVIQETEGFASCARKSTVKLRRGSTLKPGRVGTVKRRVARDESATISQPRPLSADLDQAFGKSLLRRRNTVKLRRKSQDVDCADSGQEAVTRILAAVSVDNAGEKAVAEPEQVELVPNLTGFARVAPKAGKFVAEVKDVVQRQATVRQVVRTPRSCPDSPSSPKSPKEAEASRSPPKSPKQAEASRCSPKEAEGKPKFSFPAKSGCVQIEDKYKVAISKLKMNNEKAVTQKAKLEQEKMAKAKLELEREKRAKEAEAKLAREKEEKERMAKAKLETAIAEQKKLAKERLEREKEEKEKLAKEKLEKEKEEERIAKERQEREKEERERMAREKHEREKEEQEKLAREKLEKENEEERIAKAKLEKEKEETRAKQEKLKEEQKKLAKARQERERLREEQEKLAKAKLEKAIAEQRKLAKEKLEKDKEEREKIAKAKIEKEKEEQRKAKEKQEKEEEEQRKAKEKLEKEKEEQRIAKEKQEKEEEEQRKAKEKLEKEKEEQRIAKERQKKEEEQRKAKEKLEKEKEEQRIAKERQKKEEEQRKAKEKLEKEKEEQRIAKAKMEKLKEEQRIAKEKLEREKEEKKKLAKAKEEEQEKIAKAKLEKAIAEQKRIAKEKQEKAAEQDKIARAKAEKEREEQAKIAKAKTLENLKNEEKTRQEKEITKSETAKTEQVKEGKASLDVRKKDTAQLKKSSAEIVLVGNKMADLKQSPGNNALGVEEAKPGNTALGVKETKPGNTALGVEETKRGNTASSKSPSRAPSIKLHRSLSKKGSLVYAHARALHITLRAASRPADDVISDSDSDSDSSTETAESDSETDSESETETETETETEESNGQRTSTSSNDSGFNSSPGSPAVNKKTRDCDVNCHKKCEKLMAHLCGVNQKLIVEALASVKKGSGACAREPGSPGPASNPALRPDDELAGTGHGSLTGSAVGRVTPPATTIPRYRKYAVDDFRFLKVLGKGSFGKVLLAELKGTECYYAVKCLKKDVVLEDDDVECTLIERKVLALGTKHPYLCHLFCTFQTESHLFFVMEYLNGGDLMFHIQQSGRFEEPRARFYAAEIVSGLKFLHKKGIVYRDLKLDNILLDFDGHVRIADFGMCKLQIFLDRTADTFCGTPDYMAPEIIKGLKYNQCVDWWSFGILLYEMLTGQSPFTGCDEDDLFWSICNEQPHFPRFLSHEAHSLLTALLEKEATKRLGTAECTSGDVTDQAFFRGMDWHALERRALEAPFKPRVTHALDVQYFDTAFTNERAHLTPVDRAILQSMDQTQFAGFSYTNPNATD